jgi:hypothetical protein
MPRVVARTEYLALLMAGQTLSYRFLALRVPAPTGAVIRRRLVGLLPIGYQDRGRQNEGRAPG